MATVAFVVFFVVVGLGVVLVAMRSGSRRPLLDPDRRSGRRAVAWLAGLAVIVLGIGIPVLVGINNNNDAKAQAGAIKLTAAEQRGREVFARNCAQCHTLHATNSVGRVGPNLDDLRPPKVLVTETIKTGRAGGAGQMPAMLVTGADANDVAAFVARVAGHE